MAAAWKDGLMEVKMRRRGFEVATKDRTFPLLIKSSNRQTKIGAIRQSEGLCDTGASCVKKKEFEQNLKEFFPWQGNELSRDI